MFPLRLDRWITLRLGGPLPCNPLKQQLGIPILMYHSISDDPESGVAPYYRLTTPPVLFRAHLSFLQREGITTLALDHALRGVEKPGLLPLPCVVITFDDGFRDFYTAAFPMLQEFGGTATVYLPTCYISDNRATFKGRECLTWSEVRELHAYGICFGSHTARHPVLHSRTWCEVGNELRESKRTVEDRLGSRVDHFSYPYAYPKPDTAYCARFSALLDRIGYRSCVTTCIGRFGSVRQRYQIPRLPVNAADDLPLFAAKLRGAYDWMGHVQSGFKMLSKLVSGRQPVSVRP